MRNKLINKAVLVTGCAGFIGSFIVEALLAEGAYVRGIDNLNTGSLDNIKHLLTNPKFDFTNGDILNQKLTERKIKGVDYVYHAAVRGIGLSVDNPLLEVDVNIKGTLLLLELIRKVRIKRFIYASSASVYGNPRSLPEKEADLVYPLSPYGVSKLAAERYVLAYHHLYKMQIVALRYFNIYGPRQRNDSLYGGVVSIFIHKAFRNKPLEIYGDGKQTRDFTYINDAIQATIASFTAKDAVGNVINISGGKEYSVKFLAQKVKEISENPQLAIIHTQKRLIDNVQRRFGDISLAKKVLSYSPRTSLDEGLKITFDWHKKIFTK